MKKITVILITFLSFNFLQSQTTTWTTSSTNIHNTNTGNVGIGTSNPLFKLDVNGDAHIQNNLYVDGQILITDKVQSGIIRTDSIVLDSTTKIIGNPTINGDLKANSKLDVMGSARFSGGITSTQGISLDNSNNVSISYNPSPGSNIVSYGKILPWPPPGLCPSPNTGNSNPMHVFNGFMTSRAINGLVNSALNVDPRPGMEAVL